MKQQRVYIVTNPQYKKDNLYKIGFHTGTKKDLEKRCHTLLMNMEIVRFTNSLNNKQDEKELHDLFKEYREPNYEWFKIERQELLEKYDNYFKNKTTIIDVDILSELQHRICNLEEQNIKLLEQNIKLLERVEKLETLEKNNDVHAINPTPITPVINITNPININTQKEPPENSDFDKFINHIISTRPIWYKPRQWVHHHVLYNKFINDYTTENISQKTFTVKMRNRIFNTKKQKQMNKVNRMALYLYDWDRIR